ncbi:MAG: hypothetical protein EXS15_04220 [Phycisphaerales bacterium]|nr:hypothetical protein [Phycisphaerales bacterium]
MTQWQEPNTPRPPENPRRVIGGYKFKRKQGIEDLPWTAEPLLRAVLEAADAETREEGYSYALSGQTVTMLPFDARIAASVQGRSSRPYQLEITFTPWTPEEWDKIIAALCGEAIFAARFLIGEMPASTATVVADLGIRTPLVPIKPGAKGNCDPLMKCSCGATQPCKHVVAMMHILAERLEEEPLLLLQLRGMPVARVLERIHEKRTLATRGANQAHPTPQAANDHALVTPLETMLHDFWRPGRRLHDLESRPVPTHTPHALLRRLGASPLGGRFPLVGLLATIYDIARERGTALRDRV